MTLPADEVTLSSLIKTFKLVGIPAETDSETLGKALRIFGFGCNSSAVSQLNYGQQHFTSGSAVELTSSVLDI